MMSKGIIASTDNEIEKQKFHRYKNPLFFFKKMNIDNILISYKIYPSNKNYKYFIG